LRPISWQKYIINAHFKLTLNCEHFNLEHDITDSNDFDLAIKKLEIIEKPKDISKYFFFVISYFKYAQFKRRISKQSMRLILKSLHFTQCLRISFQPVQPCHGNF
jgi:hypothetical protein